MTYNELVKCIKQFGSKPKLPEGFWFQDESHSTATDVCIYSSDGKSFKTKVWRECIWSSDIYVHNERNPDYFLGIRKGMEFLEPMISGFIEQCKQLKLEYDKEIAKTEEQRKLDLIKRERELIEKVATMYEGSKK